MPIIDESKLTSELTDKYEVSGNTFISKQKEFETEIGDSKQSDFLPQLKIKKWDNESNFSARLNYSYDNPTLNFNKNMIIWQDNKLDARFYDSGNNYEFDIVLKEKPNSNILQFTINDKDLVYYYQDAETILADLKPGRTIGSEILNSYAVYHATKQGNYENMMISGVRGKNYMAGKAFHLYRPKAFDSGKNEEWCDLNIEGSIMNLIVPQKFLDNAVYPVIVDPTFGNTSAGATNAFDFSNAQAHLSGPGLAYVANAGDTVTKISLNILSNDAAQERCVTSLYYQTSLTKIGSRAFTPVQISGIGFAQNWYDSDAVSWALVAGSQYTIAIGSPTSTFINFFYDNLITSGTSNQTATALTGSWVQAGRGTRRMSLYATYTAGGAGVVPYVIGYNDLFTSVCYPI